MAQEAVTGTIFDIKTYAIHDGPGIRTTVFLKGCPARCLWCANPESLCGKPELAFFASRCTGCGACAAVCPVGAVKMVDGRRVHERNACHACGHCVEACPSEALEMMGRSVSVNEVMEKLLTDRPFWSRSGGGVTLSGGEPLLQTDFSRALLVNCQERYVHTALETCLYASEKVLESLEGYVDFFMCDLKVMDDQRHRELTGVSNRLVLANLARLLGGSKPLLVRMPLVPGWNDDRDNLEQMGRFLESHRNGVELELLPYHRFGEGKYERLGLQYSLADVKPPSEKQMDRARNVFGQFNVQIVEC